MENLYTDYNCIRCLLDKYTNLDSIDIDNAYKTQYIKEVLKLISEKPVFVSAPEIVEEITSIQNKFGIHPLDFSALKTKFNKAILSMEESIWNTIESSYDPILKALKYSFVGNYIDFGSVSNVTEETLHGYLDSVDSIEIENQLYTQFIKELSSAKSLVYLTDNCGEIVFDKLLIKAIKTAYPNISVSAIVRGKDILNDATMQDAKEVHLTELVPVFANGSGVAGTVLQKIIPSCRTLIESADILISKGMGNFETLNGCGHNIYYVFMCKCEKFCKAFQKPRFSYMFLNEKNL